MTDYTFKGQLKTSGDNSEHVNSISALEDKFSSGIFRSPSDRYFIELSCQYLEKESVILLQTYNETYRRLFKNNMLMDSALSIEMDEIDFSLVISPLAKILETELNFSIVQWFRAQVGVPMPQYYHEDMRDWVPTAEQENEYRYIDVNFKNKSMTIGTTIRLLRHYDAKKTLPGPLAKHTGFIDACDRLREARNIAAHSGYADRNAFEGSFSAFSELKDRGVFASLAEIKEAIRQ